MFNKFILSPFLQTVKEHGSLPAFCINSRFFTYEELGKQISGIRSAIKNYPGKSRNVCLVANDDIETYASVFALWLEGKAYVPVHPDQPEDRCREIISQAGIDLVLESGQRHKFPDIDTIHSSSLPPASEDLEPAAINGSELAYILFTSGSTGKPKGVPITRENLGHFMKAFWETGITISETDRCLQAYEMTFDLSVQSFLVPLTRGACTYTVPLNQIKYSYVYGLMDDHQLTFLPVPPSLIRFLRPYFEEIEAPYVRYNILGAEASQVELIHEWSRCIPQSEIYNFYGPTEATIYCTRSKFNNGRITKNINGLMYIGKPLPGMYAVILDEHNKVVKEANVKGELCVSGDQLTPGYLNNPERNQQVFFEIEYEGRNRRFYRTGDLCLIDEEGDILYGGRLDYQVKVQGYRIELGEIEYHARAFLEGRNAACVTFENKLQNTEIAMFIEGSAEEIKRLEEYLQGKIPSYMIPSRILPLGSFPLNTNAKVDRLALRKILDSYAKD